MGARHRMGWSLYRTSHTIVIGCPLACPIECYKVWKHDDHTLSYADALAQTDSESVEAIVSKRRILFAGFVARMGEERLPQRVMFGELVGGKGYSGGQEKD